jgi:hypothetical protein
MIGSMGWAMERPSPLIGWPFVGRQSSVGPREDFNEQ